MMLEPMTSLSIPLLWEEEEEEEEEEESFE